MNCSVCGKQLDRKATSGLCKPHFVERLNARPDRSAKLSEAAKRFNARPESRAIRCAAARKAVATKRANPELMAKLARNMREIAQPASMTPESLARRNWAERGPKISATKLSFVPADYRPLYRQLILKDVKKADAIRMVRDQIAADNARLSPFEKADRALERGGTLVANDRGHSLDNPGNYGEHRWEAGRVG